VGWLNKTAPSCAAVSAANSSDAMTFPATGLPAGGQKLHLSMVGSRRGGGELTGGGGAEAGRLQRAGSIGAHHPPCVSIIVPVRNEDAYIGSCLSHLIGQTYPRERMEIIIVDCLSDDGTRKIVGEIQAEGTRRAERGAAPIVRLIDEPKHHRAAALNAGIKAAAGDIVVRIDARSIVPPDYVERCVSTLLETGADNVGGIQEPIARAPMQKAIGAAMAHPFGVGNAQFRIGRKSGPVDSVYLGSFRREVFDRVGLFDDSVPVISEDSDINQRIRESGGIVYLNTAIHAHYYPRETLGGLWRLYFHYGGARAGNLLKHGNLTAWRQWVPPAFVLLLGVLGGLAVVDRARLPLLIVVAGAYLLCDVGVSGYLGYTRGEWFLWPRLLAVFPAMHIAWALGFLTRIITRVCAQSPAGIRGALGNRRRAFNSRQRR